MMDGQVLKLNKAYMPLEIISWKDAISDWLNGKVEIIEEYEDKIIHKKYDKYLDIFSNVIKMPAVVRLLHFVVPNKDINFFQSFTRRHVYDRDDGKCQYCGTKISLKDMTYDHVHPQSKGGLTCWTNIVCSCLKCNAKKSDKTLQEVGMKLQKKPIAPIIADSYQNGMIAKLKKIKNINNNEKWLNYLYWNVELKQD